MSGRDIQLDGAEISVLKAIGTSGSPIFGALLLKRAGDLGKAEFLDTLVGLIEQGYVVSNKVNIRLIEDVERSFFRISPGDAKDLRAAMNPGRYKREGGRSRRQRRA